MERLYESKAVANDKAMQVSHPTLPYLPSVSELTWKSAAVQGVGNIPMETLEQHTYRSMEKKYGE